MKNIKKDKFLTKKQLQAIGYLNKTQVPCQYWNQQISQYFKSYANLSKNLKRQQNQTYEQFIRMSLLGPNQQGSGRFRFCDIQKIQFVIIKKRDWISNKKQKLKQKKKLKNKEINSQLNEFQSIKQIQRILSAFFQIPTNYNSNIKLSINKCDMKIIDELQMVEYQVKEGKSKGQYDVWSLFDFGLQIKETYLKYKEKQKNNQTNQRLNSKKAKDLKNTILLFLIEAQLLEDDNEVDGRAIGNGVAFVSFSTNDFKIMSKKQLCERQFPCYTLPIMIHECLHTLGFDHCTAWECLMNSVTNDQYSLCPACLRKLQSQIIFKSTLQQWYSQMAQTLRQIRFEIDTKFKKQKTPCLISPFIFCKKELLDQTLQNKLSGKSTQTYIKQRGQEQSKASLSQFSLLQKYSRIIKSIHSSI